LNGYHWELYKLDEDPTQYNDVSAKYPDKLKEMKDVFMQEAQKYDVLPLDNTSLSKLPQSGTSRTRNQRGSRLPSRHRIVGVRLSHRADGCDPASADRRARSQRGNPPDMDDVGMRATTDARPIHRVYVDGFYMDETDVTNAQFSKFVKATGYGELVEKLAALVPAPRFHLVRYFGILASAAKQRPSIVPVPPTASRVESCGHRDTSEKEKPHARDYSWSQLMARIFAVDVLE